MKYLPFFKLMENAFHDGNGMVFWEKDVNARKNNGKTSEVTKVEIAAYAILAHVKLGIPQQAIPIVKWLVSRRNSNGGFSSSSDTVIGIQALAEIALDLYSEELNMDVRFSFDKGSSVEFNLNKDNRIVPQSKSISPVARRVTVAINGTGVASLQVSQTYNRKLEEGVQGFNLSVTTDPNVGENFLHLKICANYYPQNEKDPEKTGMTIIEVTFPSGFVYDSDSDLLSSADIKVKSSAFAYILCLFTKNLYVFH